MAAPAVAVAVNELIEVDLNPADFQRIVRVPLANLRHEVGRGTIANVLQAAGMEPAPPRRQGMTWKEFLRTHWEVLAATDFFTVELWSGWGRVRYHVVFVIKLATREVHISGMVPEPNGAWMKQVARNLIDPMVGFLRGTRWLLDDRPVCLVNHSVNC